MGSQDQRLRRVVREIEHVTRLLEADYTYDYVNEKRLVLGSGGASGNCEYCEDAADLGWIGDDETFEGPMGDEDGPPLHPNCFLAGTLVAPGGRIAAHTKRWYAGKVVVLGVPGADDISVTPNHPILTRRGWIAAGRLQFDDELVQCLRPSLLLPLIYPHHDYVESAIENISDALLMSGGVSAAGVPASAEAFHGDSGVDGEVDIVRTNRSLPLRTMTADGIVDFFLRSSEGTRISLSRESALSQILCAAFHPTNGIVGGFGLRGLLRGRELVGSDLTGGASITMQESACIPVPSNRDPAYSDTPRNLQDALASYVRFVKPTDIGAIEFSGHVFNLETEDGFYCANTIIAHNCDCTLEYRERRVRVYD